MPIPIPTVIVTTTTLTATPAKYFHLKEWINVNSKTSLGSTNPLTLQNWDPAAKPIECVFAENPTIQIYLESSDKKGNRYKYFDSWMSGLSQTFATIKSRKAGSSASLVNFKGGEIYTSSGVSQFGWRSQVFAPDDEVYIECVPSLSQDLAPAGSSYTERVESYFVSCSINKIWYLVGFGFAVTALYTNPQYYNSLSQGTQGQGGGIAGGPIP